MDLRSIAMCFLGIAITVLSMAQGVREYAANSVLAEGEWYKIGLVEDGLYRIDANFLNELGVNTSSLDPRNIQLFGNGGGMVPQANSVKRYDDLFENAIYIEGEDDGNFGSSDFILFYGEGPHTWSYDKESSTFAHELNLYADTNYYFLHIAQTPGKRIETAEALPGANFFPTNSLGRHYHEVEKENRLHSGRYWLGERFDGQTNRTWSFYVGDRVAQGDISVRLRVAARANRFTQFRISSLGNNLGILSIPGTNLNSKETTEHYARIGSYSLASSEVEGDSLRITLDYDKAGSSESTGWLDWIEVSYEQDFDVQDRNASVFSIYEGVEPGKVGEINIKNASNAYRIWDISDPLVPLSYSYELVNNSLQVKFRADSPKEFLVFKGDYLQPISGEPLANQDLHGLTLADYIIITHRSFTSASERLAQFHRDHYGRVAHVVDVEQIYNEFSSGRRDVSAIRDFIKMFYDQSGGALPLAVLLMGDGSFDQRGILLDPISQQPTALSYLPTYQSRNSWNPVNSYASDDFFGIMDDGEGFWGEGSGVGGDTRMQVNLINIGIGRLPVKSPQEADQMVNKIINYATNTLTAGSWRNRVLLVADHREGEGSTHVRQADGYTSIINGTNPCINIDKVYMDNYPAISTPTALTFPDARKALLDELDKGSLIVNYTGHGGETAWSNSRIFQNADISGINNDLRLPVVVTATCEFGRFDDPTAEVSGAELMALEEFGGAIALFTTVRLVYSSPNETLNANFYRQVFTYDANKKRMPTLGEIMKRTKNTTFIRGNLANINSRNFTLIGDPGLILNYPRLRAELTQINGLEIGNTKVDTLSSLSTVEVKGKIMDDEGNLVTDFNGELEATIFDKPSKFTTRLSNFSFFWRKNKIFNGSVSVVDGEFTFKFVVPLDVSYDEGLGKMSIYFSNASLDGGGCFDDFSIGGTNTSAAPDNEGPTISLFMNDANWKDGGITNENPFVLANVSDPSGINTVGSGIGHEIIAILDNDDANPIILNDFYSADKDSYTSGSVNYLLRDLEEGEHQLTLRVWDGANNVSEAYTIFRVVKEDVLELGTVQAIPNPFTNGSSVTFSIDHNQAGKEIEMEAQVFSISGQLIANISEQFLATGFTSTKLVWEGRTVQGNLASPGMYSYRIRVKDMQSGREAYSFGKLMMLTN